MKKIFVFSVTVVLLFLLSGSYATSYDMPAGLFNSAEFIMYYDNDIVDKSYFNNQNIKTTQNGNSYFVSVNLNEFNKIISSGNFPKSYSAKFNLSGDEVAKKLLDIKKYYGYEFMWQESVEDINIIYAKSSKNLKSLSVLGKEINLTVAVSENNIVIGYPVILHSF